jgi:hypothetical protein
MLPLEPTPYSKNYEITDAMFAAFRTSGGMRFFWKLFGWLTLAYSGLYAVLLPSVFKSYLSFVMMAVEMGDNPSSEQTAAMFSNMMLFIPSVLLLSLLGFVIMAVSRAAFFRGYFFDETGSFFPFRLGADEVRQGLAILGYWGVYLLAYLIPYILLIVVIGILVALSSGNGSGAATVVLAVILGLFGGISLIVFLIWVMVALAPAGALTARRGKTHVLAARHVSKNRFWALFGSLLVAGLIGYVVAYIFIILGFTVGLAGFFNGEMMNALLAEDFDQVMDSVVAFSESSGFKIGVFFAIVLSSAGAAFYSLIIAGPQAFFTRQWVDSGAAAYEERQP